jgi:GTP-binding protein
VVKEGRALILVINKWDLVAKEWQVKALKYMRKQVERSLGEVKNVVMVPISANNNYQLDVMMDEVLKTYDKWNRRISTGSFILFQA